MTGMLSLYEIFPCKCIESIKILPAYSPCLSPLTQPISNLETREEEKTGISTYVQRGEKGVSKVQRFERGDYEERDIENSFHTAEDIEGKDHMI